MAQVIYTYFEGLIPQSHDVLECFARNWESRGFRVEVLVEKDAKINPMYDYLMREVEKYPTLNSRDFEMACYKRWCAFAHLKDVDGIYILDYDILNQRITNLPDLTESTTFLHTAMGYWRADDLRKFVYRMMSFPKWRWQEHNSDMIIHQLDFNHRIYLAPLICDYPDMSLPLVHFTSCYSKADFIRLIKTTPSLTQPLE